MDKRNIITIGIMEETKSKVIFNYLKKILLEEGYEICYTNTNDNIVILRKDEKEIIAIDISIVNIKVIKSIGLEFNIFIHNIINKEIDKNDYLNDILKTCEYLVLNCDKKKWNLLIKDNVQSVVVTYGFNNKATVTLSSYCIDDFAQANICFQRTINSINGLEINPFELHIKLNSNREEDIYSVIATIIGISIFDSSIVLNKSTITI